ncbi:hypothetical protein AD943_03550 [Gluconobacter roseus]|nr:hypothetical protein AD943_03550 [Gluconobacter roseus]
MSKHLFADGAYDCLKFMNKAVHLDFSVEITRRRDGAISFEVLRRGRLPRRMKNTVGHLS